MTAKGVVARLRPGRGTSSRGSSLTVEMAARMGRDSLFYTIVTGAIFPLGLANALVLTDYLTSSQYGQLAVLFVVSGMTTVVLNLLFLRGIERQVWGSTDEGVDVDLAQLVSAAERKRTLGTGIVLTTILAILLTVAVIPLAPWLSKLLLHTRHQSAAIIWMASSAGLGSVWRLSSNIVRWERRHKSYAAVYSLRPVLAIVIAVPLLAGGAGLAGAVAATAIATILSTIYGLLVTRRSYAVLIDRAAGISITRTSAQFAAMVVGIYILHNGDVFMLSRVASSSKVGVFNLATNLTSAISYGVSAFLMAWAPLEWSTLFQAAYEQNGRERMRSAFITYYMIVGIFLVLLMAALAAPLVGIFSVTYAKAQGYVAITGAGYIAYGLFLVLARTSSFPARYAFYGVAAFVSAGALVAIDLWLGPSLAGYGVAIGDIVGGLAGAGVILLVAATLGQLPPAELGRIIRALLIGGACWAIEDPLAKHLTSVAPLLKVASVVLFPLALVIFRVVPRQDVSVLWAVIRRTLRSRTPSNGMVERVRLLPPTERRIVLSLMRDRDSVARAAIISGLPEATVRLRLISALRRLSEAGPPGAHDDEIAEYLLAEISVTERDGLIRTLLRSVGPIELHKIDSAFHGLHDAPRKEWSAVYVDPAGELPPALWPLDGPALALLDAVVRHQRPRQEVAAELGLDLREIDRRLITALRALSSGGEGSGRPADGLIASFLFDTPRRLPARQLWAAGVDPLELHRMELVIEAIRAMAPESWSTLTTGVVAAAPEAEPVPQLMP